MKHLSIFLTLALLLAACNSPAAMPSTAENVSSEEEITSSVPKTVEFSSASQSDAILFTWRMPILEKPSAEQVASVEFWKNDEYLANLIKDYPDNFHYGDLLSDSGDIYFPISRRLRRWGILGEFGDSDAYLSFIKNEDGHYYHELNLDEYMLLAKLMYGGENTGVGPSEYLPSLSEWFDYKNNNVLLRFSYDAQHKYLGDLTITKITPLADNGVDAVQLSVEDRSNNNITIINKIITLDLFWDEQIGYVPQKIISELPDNPVTIQGDVKTFPLLWNDTANEDYYTTSNMNFFGLENIITIGDMAYRFHTDGGTLTADTLNLETMVQQADQVVYQFDSENITGFRNGRNGLIIRTNTAVYLFDDSLRVKERRPWPEKLLTNLPEKAALILSDDISLAAYVIKDGVYLCEIAENAEPKLLQKHPEPESDNVVDYKFMYPICFIGNGNDRLFTGVEMWERAAAYFRIIDTKGNTLDEIPLTATFEHSGGYYEYNQAGAIYYDPITRSEKARGNYYYDFEKGKLEQIDWLQVRYNSFQYQCLPHPEQPNLWYIYAPKEDYDEPRRPIFMQIDFKAGTLSEMPLVVTGAYVTMLAVNEDGKILFSYVCENESGFGVYHPALN